MGLVSGVAIRGKPRGLGGCFYNFHLPSHRVTGPLLDPRLDGTACFALILFIGSTPATPGLVHSLFL